MTADDEQALLVAAFRNSSRHPEHLAFLAAPVVEQIIAQRSAATTTAVPVAYRLATGRIVHQTYAQRWVNTDGYPLALVPDLTDAVALYYTENPPC